MLYFNSCNRKMEYILIQERYDGPGKSICYWYSSSVDSEEVYNTTHHSFQAVVPGTNILWSHLEVLQFIVCTHYNALHWISKIAAFAEK